MSDSEPENKNEHNRFWISRDEAYKIGVLEASTYPVIFVDPDAKDGVVDQIKAQMESQVPGLVASIEEIFNKKLHTPSGKPVSDIRELATSVLKERFVVDGKEYGLAFLPTEQFDSKKEIVESFTKNLASNISRAVYENMPGTNNDWMRYIGNHEGTHLQVSYTYPLSDVEILIEERRADQGAADLARERGQGELVLAFKDRRSLLAFYDPTHATTPVLDQNDQVTDMTFSMAESFLFYSIIGVMENFDFSLHKTNGGKAEKSLELLSEDPDAYFEASRKALELLKAKVMKDYNDDQTLLDNQRAVVEAQLRIDYQEGFEDAYRRRVLGQDIPEREPTQLIPQKAEDAYLAKKELHDKMRHLEEAAGRNVTTEFSSYKLKEELIENYDWSSYPRKVEEYDDLTLDERNNLKRYLFLEKRAEVVEDFKNNPSLESFGRAVGLQKAIRSIEYNINSDRSLKGKNC